MSLSLPSLPNRQPPAANAVQHAIKIPLLRDAHTHPLLYAAFMDGVDLGRDPAEGREAAVERVRRDAESRNGEGWTIAYAWHSGRYPLFAADFDDLPPVFVLNLSLHGLIVNRSAMEVLQRHDPEAADRLGDQAWIERNLRRVLNLLAGGVTAGALRRFYDHLLQEHGVFHAEEMLLVEEREIRLFDEAGLANRTRFWAAPEQYEALPPDLKERVHGIKLFTDGALGAWSAALHEPYRGASHRGDLVYESAELVRTLERCLAFGKPLAIHAIGDRALDELIAALLETRAAEAVPVRIEHAQFISEQAARTARDVGLTLCMQPNFSDDSRHYLDRLPPGYPERNNPFRMLIDVAGFVPGRDLLLGSDGMPHGFAEGLRQSLFPPIRGQALSVEEFVAGYCLPDTAAGRIEVEIDAVSRTVDGRVVLPRSPVA